ncbi:MAG: lipopolysaccharide assembly protein LapA domain-containing protein [Rhodospirillales bacterium]
MSKLLFWIVAVPLAAAIVVFSVNNRTDVVLDLWPLDMVTAPLPVFAVVLASGLAGFIAGGLVAWMSAGKARTRARAEARRAEEAERARATAEERLERLEKEAADSAEERPPLPVDAA